MTSGCGALSTPHGSRPPRPNLLRDAAALRWPAPRRPVLQGAGRALGLAPSPPHPQRGLPPPTGDAAAALAELAVVVRPNTRLASTVRLEAAMDGAVLALGKLRPWKTL